MISEENRFPFGGSLALVILMPGNLQVILRGPAMAAGALIACGDRLKSTPLYPTNRNTGDDGFHVALSSF
jgi:hypothetical protein